ncbi:Haloacid dehalogenase-like hydrolase superfamily protein [Perilla frutescens var. hirtella]|uniref:Haloacid dehalogenase-like hydrolase superfamily protein n=1 Tax=Perilla frutescens var. hirtella TaxID=608512 RepID=A0AAD4J4Y5_PERFH|nr:Haloacid dehalogenase-like hydrolase superfamily protein [Perilla frutescens var. hirtella]
MAELASAEVYAPRTIQVWRTLLNWLAFFFQIFAQILRGTPSFTQVLSYVGLRQGSFLSSTPHAPPQFKPLPVVELPEFSEEHEEAPPRLTSPGAVPVHGGGERTGDSTPLGKLTVVLDLDETLVCAYETSSLPTMLRSQATEAGIKWFELECISSDKEFEGKPKINYVTVFERPGLKEFLKQLSEFADLILFTAGLEGYARPLVDKIDSENLFSHRLYRPSTISTEYREHVKDLSCLSKEFCRIVIVDNNPFSFLLQPLNGIPCIPFSPGQPHDEQLLDVILPLLKHLSLQKDVRPVLYERFHMPEWFQKHGIPTSGWT